VHLGKIEPHVHDSTIFSALFMCNNQYLSLLDVYAHSNILCVFHCNYNTFSLCMLKWFWWVCSDHSGTTCN